MRPQFGSRPNAAVLTSGEVAIRRAIAFASPAVAAPLTSISRRMVAPSPSATICCARSAQTSPSAPANSASVAAVRSTPLSPFASRMTASFVEHSPSTEILLKLWLTARLRKPCASAALQRVVGGDDREHRREVRVDHPGALRHPADREAAARDDCLLGERVGGQDRLRRLAAAVRRDLDLRRGRRAASASAASPRSLRSRGRAPARGRSRAATRSRTPSRARPAHPACRSPHWRCRS